jgi:alpha-amylase
MNLLSNYKKGYVTEFRYCSKIAWGIKDYGQLSNLIDYGWGMARSDRAFIFTDNHDNQRGHGGGGIDKKIAKNSAHFN